MIVGPGLGWYVGLYDGAALMLGGAVPVFEYETSPSALLTASRCADGRATPAASRSASVRRAASRRLGARAAADVPAASTAALSPVLSRARVAGLSNASPPRVPPVSRCRTVPWAAPTDAAITSAALQTASQYGLRLSLAWPAGASPGACSIWALQWTAAQQPEAVKFLEVRFGPGGGIKGPGRTSQFPPWTSLGSRRDDSEAWRTGARGGSSWGPPEVMSVLA